MLIKILTKLSELRIRVLYSNKVINGEKIDTKKVIDEITGRICKELRVCEGDEIYSQEGLSDEEKGVIFKAVALDSESISDPYEVLNRQVYFYYFIECSKNVEEIIQNTYATRAVSLFRERGEAYSNRDIKFIVRHIGFS